VPAWIAILVGGCGVVRKQLLALPLWRAALRVDLCFDPSKNDPQFSASFPGLELLS